MKYSSLFHPVKLGNITIRNRVAFAPINNSSQSDPSDGTIKQECVDYFVERAKGGTGLIITGVFKVENEIEKCINIKEGLYKWPVVSRKSITKYAELASRVNAYGGKIFMQLSGGPGRVTYPEVVASGVTPVSASANQCFYVPNVACRAIETNEVAQIVHSFGEAAKIVASAGIDGVEIHGHEGYLIDQFSTALWNRRTDKYGGDLRGRLTFSIEILNSIKNAVGADYPVTFRMGAKHYIRGPWKSAIRGDQNEMGRDIEESIEMAKILEEAGYDGLSIDTGCYESSYWAHPPYYHQHGMALDMAARIKSAVKIPVMVAGRLEIPDMANDAVEQGKADMIVIGRGLLADPDWAQKVSTDEVEDIRPCLSCQDGCLQRCNSIGAKLACSVNPSCARESANPIIPAGRKKRILIAGGGVAGMEAARMASIRGHEVLLFEKTDNLGGHLIEASVPDFKDDLKRLLAWYKRQIDVQKVHVEYGTAVDEQLISDIKPDSIIIATGSNIKLPVIPGIDKASVATCCELLLSKKKAGRHTIIVGGGLEGSETALWLARQGIRVTIVEMLPTMVNGVRGSNRNMLVDLLEDIEVEQVVNARLYEVTDDGIVIITQDMSIKRLKCDTVAMATGMTANRELYNSLTGNFGDMYEIGDCKKPRKIHDAIWEGWNVGLTI